MSKDTQTLALTDFLLARIAETDVMLASVVDTVERHGGRLIDAHDLIQADYEAKRRIVELHKPVTDPAWPEQVFCDELETGADSAYPCPTIRILAAVYADHPDYREEWKP